MPRLRVSEEEERARRVRALLSAKSEIRGVKAVKVAEGIGMSRNSYHNKFKDPKQFRVGEILLLQAYLNISPQEMGEAFFGVKT